MSDLCTGGYLFAFASYVIYFSYLAIRLYSTFQTHAYDLGYYDSVIWNTAHGRPFYSTLLTKPTFFLGDHFSPALAALAPIYWVWSDIRALLITETVLLALGSVPVFLIARSFSPLLALISGVAYFFNPYLHAVNLKEFHETSLMVPLLSFTLFFLLRKRYHLMLVFLFAALMVKEEIGFTVAAVGIYLLVFVKMRRLGLILLAIGAGWVLIIPTLIIPIWGVNNGYSHILLYQVLGNSPGEALSNIVRNPLLLPEAFLKTEKLVSIFRLFFSFLFLPLLAPRFLLLALPAILYLGISPEAVHYGFWDWYSPPILPVMAVASVVALARLPKRIALAGAVLLFVASVTSYLTMSPELVRRQSEGFDATKLSQIGKVFSLIPPNAWVTAQCDLFPHLSQRQGIYVFPDYAKTEFIVLDREGDPYPLVKKEFGSAVNEALSKPEWRIIEDLGPFLLLQRMGEPALPTQYLGRFGGEIGLRQVQFDLQAPDGSFEALDQHLEQQKRTLHPGDKVRIIFYWEALGSMDTDYTVFIHLLNANGDRIGQDDSQPTKGVRPTGKWQVGDVVRDVHYLEVDSQNEIDGLRVATGFYQWPSMSRLPASTPDGTIYLQFTPR